MAAENYRAPSVAQSAELAEQQASYIGMPVGEKTVARAVASLDQSLTFAQDFRAEDVRVVLAALAARQSRITLLPDDPRIVKKIAHEIERGKLDHPGFFRNTQLAEALRRMLDAALAAQPAQGIDLAQPAPSVTRYRIEDAPGLDPVTVYVENYAPGKGRMVVTCYASAWTAFWGAMGDDTTLEQFVASCSPEYVADNMIWGADTKKSTKGYADKVAAAVVAFFKSQRDAAPEVGNG